MFKLLAVLFTFFIFSCPNLVFAEGEFAASYKVDYEILEDGATLVTEDVILKNLTNMHYASSFNFLISSTKVSDVKGFDKRGDLTVETEIEGQKTKIIVHLRDQITGKDKEQGLTLKFRSGDFAQKIGNIWQVSIPKLVNISNLEDYNLRLVVPIALGDPAFIVPEPVSLLESGGKIVYLFKGSQLENAGVLASFGTEQPVNFEIDYLVKNNGILPTVKAVPLPFDNNYQDVAIYNIDPVPENVTVDDEGNYLGWFKVGSRNELKVKVNGAGILKQKSGYNDRLKDEEFKKYTSSNKYWAKDNPIIKSKVKEILGSKSVSNYEKAKKINEFVTKSLSLDYENRNGVREQRLGAVTALTNPGKSLALEFSDLFIAMARASGVPARMIVGYAHSSNQDIRPLSFKNEKMHVWPEFYDESRGWVMIDPTWEFSTGGVNYFEEFDLTHLALQRVGDLTDLMIDAGTKMSFVNQVDKPFQSELVAKIYSEKQVFGGFPFKAKIIIQNNGNSATKSGDIRLALSEDLKGEDLAKKFGIIPAKGYLEHTFELRANLKSEIQSELMTLFVNGKKMDAIGIEVVPFWGARNLQIFGIAAFGGIILFYAGIVIGHKKFKLEAFRSWRKKKADPR